MTQIAGSGDYVIDEVQKIVRAHVPGATCALLDYGKRIGCGELDEHGNLHEVRWLRRELDDEQVAKDAERMARLIAEANGSIPTDR
ncbi:hypothetical protein V3I01_06460 [Sphingomonas sp. gentR]|uniref:hypothetical protein n=1 Tax=unclassified Sphingomonas TaxID=196159 RepID=UPI000972C1B5|nr:hypothetical protein [Sphingomonas sp. LK11]APX66028.1 hypothetical protein AV944_09470 [Sphingomonas sp. LK11]